MPASARCTRGRSSTGFSALCPSPGPPGTLRRAQALFLQRQAWPGHLQRQRALLRAALPEPLWRFIEAGTPEWDAAIDGSRSESPRMPTAGEVDLRTLGALPVKPPET